MTEVGLQHVVALLKTISEADGFFSDLGLGYITTEPTQKPSSAQTYTVVFDTEMVPDEARQGPRTAVDNMSVTIEVIVPVSGASAPRKPSNVARRAIADIRRAIRLQQVVRPPGVNSIAITGGQRIVLEDERFTDSIVAQVTARVGLSESISPANS
jgi:hypothetical protein